MPDENGNLTLEEVLALREQELGLVKPKAKTESTFKEPIDFERLTNFRGAAAEEEDPEGILDGVFGGLKDFVTENVTNLTTVGIRVGQAARNLVPFASELDVRKELIESGKFSDRHLGEALGFTKEELIKASKFSDNHVLNRLSREALKSIGIEVPSAEEQVRQIEVPSAEQQARQVAASVQDPEDLDVFGLGPLFERNREAAILNNPLIEAQRRANVATGKPFSEGLESTANIEAGLRTMSEFVGMNQAIETLSKADERTIRENTKEFLNTGIELLPLLAGGATAKAASKGAFGGAELLTPRLSGRKLTTLTDMAVLKERFGKVDPSTGKVVLDEQMLETLRNSPVLEVLDPDQVAPVFLSLADDLSGEIIKRGADGERVLPILVDNIRQGTVPEELIARRMLEHGVDRTDAVKHFVNELDAIAEVTEGSTKAGAKMMNILSQLQEFANAKAMFSKDPEVQRAFGKKFLEAKRAASFNSNVTLSVLDTIAGAAANVKRSGMVFNLSTLSRDIVSTQHRGFIQMMESIVAKTVLKNTRVSSVLPEVDALANFHGLLDGLSPEGHRLGISILKETPTEFSKLYGQLDPDLAVNTTMGMQWRTMKDAWKQGKVDGSAVASVQDKINATIQFYTSFITLHRQAIEKFQRGMFFSARMNEHASRAGTDLNGVLSMLRSRDRPAWIDGAIEDSVQYGLETTFAAKPRTKMGRQLLEFYADHPGAALIGPDFPKFLSNKFQFLLDRNPGILLKFLNKDARAALNGRLNMVEFEKRASNLGVKKFLDKDGKKPNPKFQELLKIERGRVADNAADVGAKALGGMMSLGAAIAMRTSPEIRGPRWFDIKVGEEIDEDGIKRGVFKDIRILDPTVAPWFLVAETLEQSRRLGSLEQGLAATATTGDLLDFVIGARRVNDVDVFGLGSLARKMSEESDESKMGGIFLAWLDDIGSGTTNPLVGTFGLFNGIADGIAGVEPPILDPKSAAVGGETLRNINEVQRFKKRMGFPVPGNDILGPIEGSRIVPSTSPVEGTVIKKNPIQALFGITTKEMTPFQQYTQSIGFAESDIIGNVPKTKGDVLKRAMSRVVGTVLNKKVADGETFGDRMTSFMLKTETGMKSRGLLRSTRDVRDLRKVLVRTLMEPLREIAREESLPLIPGGELFDITIKNDEETLLRIGLGEEELEKVKEKFVLSLLEGNADGRSN